MKQALGTRVEGRRDVHREEGPAEFVVVTKRPHVSTEAGVRRIVERLESAGVQVRQVHCLGASGENIAGALYPMIAHYYDERPAPGSAVWPALRSIFDHDDFEHIMGVGYDDSLVLTGREALAQFRLTPGDLTEVWSEGRRPITTGRLVGRFGERAAHRVFGDGAASSYEWFRGPLPFGLQRVGVGLMAFALRHERLDGGDRPVIILNGHFPGLAALFAGGASLIEGDAGPAGGLAALRTDVVGPDNRPDRCPPGSIRRDAHDGHLPLDSDRPVDAQANVVHASDGLLAAAIERSALLGESPRGALVDALVDHGLTDAEVRHIVFRNPLVGVDGCYERLTDVTCGLSLPQCVAVIAKYVPPVFGAANGYAGGVSFGTFDAASRALHRRGIASGPVSEPEGRRRLLGPRPLVTPSVLSSMTRDGRSLEAAGHRLIADGKVGLLAPAAGTGGRFGGYEVPEDHPRRSKATAAVLRAGGQPRSSLDVRLANARHWRRLAHAEVPMAVMYAETNQSAVAAWEGNLPPGSSVDTYRQNGVYRLRASWADGPAGARWIDHVLRRRDGRPDLKPLGSAGSLMSFVLSPTYKSWRRRGIRYVVVASGDDVGFRLDPRVIGYMADRRVPAVIASVPWAFRATVVGGQSSRIGPLRGDSSGWCIDTAGGQWKPEWVGAATASLVGADGQRHTTAVRWDREVVVARRPADGAGFADFGIAPSEPRLDSQWFRAAHVYLDLAYLEYRFGGDESAARIVDRLPIHAERKTVTGSRGTVEAVQFHQAFADMVGVLPAAHVLALRRMPEQGQRGGFAPLKDPSDVGLAQVLLDRLAPDDELLFDD